MLHDDYITWNPERNTLLLWLAVVKVRCTQIDIDSVARTGIIEYLLIHYLKWDDTETILMWMYRTSTTENKTLQAKHDYRRAPELRKNIANIAL